MFISDSPYQYLFVGTKEALIQTFWMSSQDAATLAACISDLGELDSLNILAEVAQQVESIRSGNTSSQSESLTDSIANFFGISGPPAKSDTASSSMLPSTTASAAASSADARR